MSFTARQVLEALKYRYRDQGRSAGNVTTEEVATFLRMLPPDQLPENNDLLSCLSAEKPDWDISAADAAVLTAVGEALADFETEVDLEAGIRAEIRAAIPIIAAHLLANPTEPLDAEDVSILSLMDLLAAASIGWSADQGRAAGKFLDQVRATIEKARQPDAKARDIQAELTASLEKDEARTTKLEERLAATEAGKIRSTRGRMLAAEMINACMDGRKVTAGLESFLKGAWYESMQLVAINHGLESDEWTRARKITETLIWTYQPFEDDANKQRLYRVIEHLPGEVSSLLLTLEHSSTAAESLLADIEDDHVAVVSGQLLEYVDWEPIGIEGADKDADNASVDKSLLKKVRALEPGQWFSYEDDNRRARLKLVLKLEDVRQLLFTNRNGMKALERNFEDMAYLLTSGIVRPIEPRAIFSSAISRCFLSIVEEHEEKLKMDEAAVRQKEAEEAAAQKRQEEEKAAARAEAEELERRRAEMKATLLESAAEEAADPANREKVQEVGKLVEKLNVGAWLKLPDEAGEIVECKLAVKVASKMIFTDSSGERVGDYTGDQLVAILVSGIGEIVDAGIVFEDTLAQVVNKLRDDREKSFDDLTGTEDE